MDPLSPLGAVADAAAASSPGDYYGAAPPPDQPRERIDIQASVRGLTRAHAIQRWQASLPSLQDVVTFAALLVDMAWKRDGSALEPHELMADYDGYCTARDAVGTSLRTLLTARAFCKLPKSPEGRVSIPAIAQYVRTKMLLQHLAGCLASFSTVQDEEDGGEDGGAAPAAGAAARAARGSPAPPSRARGRSAGYQLRELDLENYIFESIPGVPELAALQENFYPFYVFTAVRKMVVLLDPTKTGRIAVRDLVASRVFADWMKMLPNGHPDLGPPGAAIPPRTSSHSRDPVLCAERIVAESWNPPPPAPTNWFSAANALRVYSQYLKLDVDQNGMLSPAELAAYRGGILTSACIGRIFAECHTYEGEIDFKGYLDVILALENRTSAASQRYLFRLLDVNHTGRVGLQELRGFCREVVDKLVASGQEPVDVANVCDEIFDMVHPRQPGYLTLDDILRCKVGHTACSIPLDAAAFFAYDRREELKGDGTEGQPEADSDFDSA